MRAPIVASELYQAVLGEEWHCQCRHDQPGGCGATHPYSGVSCISRAEHGRPLMVAPLDPDVPAHVAVRLGPEELIALCRACFTRRAGAAKKAREAASTQALAEHTDSLFDLP